MYKPIIWFFLAVICWRGRFLVFSVGTELTSAEQEQISGTYILELAVCLTVKYCIVSTWKRRFWSPKIYKLMSDSLTYSIMSWRGWYLYGDSVVKKDSKNKTWTFSLVLITTHVNVFFQLFLTDVGKFYAHRAYMRSYKLSFYRFKET